MTGRRTSNFVEGYPRGPGATVAASAAALVRSVGARSIVLVEGVSDQIARETLATRQGRDLNDEGVVVLPIGGAQAVSKFLRRFGGGASPVRVAGLCDEAEVSHVATALERAGLVEPGRPVEVESHGFFVCVKDLEDELIRAVGRAGIEAVLTAEGELGSFRTMQGQPAWRDAEFEDQTRRFLGARSGRKSRYARLLVLAVDDDRMPEPLTAVLARA